MDTDERPAPVLLNMPTHRQIDRLEDSAARQRATLGWCAAVLIAVGLTGCGVAVWCGAGNNWLAVVAAGGPGLVVLAMGVAGALTWGQRYLTHAPDGSECVYYAGQYMDTEHRRAVAVCAAHSDEAAARMEAMLLRAQAMTCEHLAEQLRERADLLTGQL